MRHGDREEVRRFYSDFLGLQFVSVLVVCVGYLATPWLIETFFASQMDETIGQSELTIRLTRVLFHTLPLFPLQRFFRRVCTRIDYSGRAQQRLFY